MKTVPFYKIRKNHDFIVGHDSPISFYDLVMYVEGPGYVSRINIWSYCEWMDIDKLIIPSNDRIKQISKGEEKNYPFYELFTSVWSGYLSSPLIFEEIPSGLNCIEGRHRLRLLTLFRKHCPNEYAKKYKLIPGIVVEHTGDNPANPSQQYDAFSQWQSSNGIMGESIRIRKAYNEFLQRE